MKKEEDKLADLMQRTKGFALGIIRLFASLPKSPEAQAVDTSKKYKL